MNVPERDQVIEQFLAGFGLSLRDACPLAQDASFRRYLRFRNRSTPGLNHESKNVIVMDSPPPEDVRPFLRIAEHLSGLGLSVPRILGADQTNGLILEEDLGDNLYSTILTETNAESLFDAAIDALIVMHRAALPVAVPRWGKTEMRDTTLGTLFDWWWPETHGAEPPAEVKAEVADALDAVLSRLDAGPICLVHRDFFAGNLIWLPDRTGSRRAGVIDFQSAAIGHPAYDLVSLLQDARRDIPVAWEARAVHRYLTARPELDASSFRAAYAACAAQRHLRVACQWVRLAVRDHRPQYLAYGPRTWHLLTRALSEPTNAALADVLDRWLPINQRRNPPGLSDAI